MLAAVLKKHRTWGVVNPPRPPISMLVDLALEEAVFPDQPRDETGILRGW